MKKQAKQTKQKKQTKPLRQFVVRFRQTETCETVIDAVDETEARAKWDVGDWNETLSIDTIDMEFVSMKEES